MKHLLFVTSWISLVGLPFSAHSQRVPYPNLVEIPNPCREGGRVTSSWTIGAWPGCPGWNS